MSDAQAKPKKLEALDRLRSTLRETIEVGDVAGLVAFADRHRPDARRGAQALVERAERRVAAIAEERARIDGLFALRRSLFEAGHRLVAGVDEVGVGPLAGPVVAAAVILPEDVELPGLDDSKKLKREQREKLALLIREQAISIGIGCVPPPRIDDLNIYHAALEAMRLAVTGLRPEPDFCLVDARAVPSVAMPQKAIIHGDAVDGSIAAASIVAKVHRDGMMRELDQRFPGYGFGRHMGYGTAFHIEALERLGPCEAHRRSFAPVAEQARRHARLR